MLIKQLDCLTVSELGTGLAFLEHNRDPMAGNISLPKARA